MPPRVSLGREVCRALDHAAALEWLETNGLGGFASSTITGLNTRRYHGLLIAATKPPAVRAVLLAKLDETVIVGGERFELGVNQYPGVLHPAGFRFLEEFLLDPFPIFRYRAGGVNIEKSVFLVQGENTVVVEYRSSAPCEMEVRPLIAFRDFHSLTHENVALNHTVDQVGDQTGPCASIMPYPDLPRLRFIHNATECAVSGDWFRNFEYAREQERGLDFHEDLFQPFVAKFSLSPASPARIIATLETRHTDTAAVDSLRQAEIDRRARLTNPDDEPFVAVLKQAADQFIVGRGAGHTVIAGYHWFADWGRDTMISLPGLALATGRFDAAKDILRTFAAYVDQGMLPNRFPDSGETPEYNTVDATLWFFEAARAYLESTGDAAFVRNELYPHLKDIVSWHVRGTRYGIHVDGDGLLACGEPGVQLTWMDAKIGDWVVTPRRGKPVEIQALWYNALRVMEQFAHAFAPPDEPGFAQLAERAKSAFEPMFWNEAANCLYDVVDGSRPSALDRDASIRPNQIFAVSLPYSMLSPPRAAKVIQTVRRELLTPAGLRTLAPSNPGYRATYAGGVVDRDSAYHQGTVWPWLMGPFLTAYLRVDSSEAARQQAEQWLRGMEPWLWKACLGQMAEIADGEPPNTPRGAIAQAWSVAEMLRVANVVLRGATSGSASASRPSVP